MQSLMSFVRAGMRDSALISKTYLGVYLRRPRSSFILSTFQHGLSTYNP
jgi:hypothetical protein